MVVLQSLLYFSHRLFLHGNHLLINIFSECNHSIRVIAIIFVMCCFIRRGQAWTRKIKVYSFWSLLLHLRLFRVRRHGLRWRIFAAQRSALFRGSQVLLNWFQELAWLYHCGHLSAHGQWLVFYDNHFWLYEASLIGDPFREGNLGLLLLGEDARKSGSPSPRL